MSQEIQGFGKEAGPDFKRLLLAGLLISAVLFVFNTFFAPPPKMAPAPVSELVKAENEPTPSLVKTPEERPLPRDLNVPVTSDETSLRASDFKISVGNAITKDPSWPQGGYELTTKNVGGSISSLAVYGYRDPIPLIEGGNAVLFELRSRSPGHSVGPQSVYEVQSAQPNQIVYKRITPEGLQIVRSYQFSADNYLLTHRIELTNLVSENQKVELDVLLKTQGEVLESSFFSAPIKDLNFLARKEDSIERYPESDVLKKKTVQLEGPIDFVGFEQRYFLVSIVPKASDLVKEVVTKAETTPAGEDIFDAEIVLSLKPIELAALETKTIDFDAYVGPKQMGLLRMTNARGLDEAINFGWFGVVSRPLLWLLVEIYGFVKNFGLAIILLTLIIKLLTFPLVQKSLVSMQQVKKIAPEVAELQKKYGHDRTLLSQKQMELYREKGVNPAAGCLPMFLQFPVWIGLYQMLNNSIEIFQKPFVGWLTDLTSPDPYFVLPILMGASMVIQQLLQPTQDDQKAFKYAMLGSSVLFTYIMINLPSGLSLYMLTNNILTVLQQLVIKRRFDAENA